MVSFRGQVASGDANDIVFSTSTDGVQWTEPARIPLSFTPTYFLPSSDQWDLGARWIRCDIYAYATPTTLADLPPNLKNALQRPKIAEDFNRCSPVSPSAPQFRHVACLEPHDWRAVAIQFLASELPPLFSFGGRLVSFVSFSASRASRNS